MSNGILMALLATTALLAGFCGYLFGRRRGSTTAVPPAPRAGPPEPHASPAFLPVTSGPAFGSVASSSTTSAPAAPDVRVQFAGLDQEVRRALEADRPLTLLNLSVDQLDAIRAHHGGEAGDRILRGVARAVRSQLRPGDLCVREGGDAFVVLVPGASGERAAA